MLLSLPGPSGENTPTGGAVRGSLTLCRFDLQDETERYGRARKRRRSSTEIAMDDALACLSNWKCN